MNGYEAAKEIRALNKDIIIIAQTAYGLVSDKEKAINEDKLLAIIGKRMNNK